MKTTTSRSSRPKKLDFKDDVPLRLDAGHRRLTATRWRIVITAADGVVDLRKNERVDVHYLWRRGLLARVASFDGWPRFRLSPLGEALLEWKWRREEFEPAKKTHGSHGSRGCGCGHLERVKLATLLQFRHRREIVTRGSDSAALVASLLLGYVTLADDGKLALTEKGTEALASFQMPQGPWGFIGPGMSAEDLAREHAGGGGRTIGQ